MGKAAPRRNLPGIQGIFISSHMYNYVGLKRDALSTSWSNLSRGQGDADRERGRERRRLEAEAAGRV